MITADNKLKILEDFIPDENLPKFESSRPKDGDLGIGFYQREGRLMMNDGSRISIARNPARRPWYKRWFTESPPPPTMSIEEFFTNVKHSIEELVVVKERAAGYEKAILAATRAGQSALCEKLEEGLNAFRMETNLVAIGLTRYVSEENVVTFYKKSPKGVRLDWSHNFVRPIPEKLIEKKVRADELEIFDNYAVMHYDPQAKSYAETKGEQEERKRQERLRRDPILFGLIRGRRVLYVIGDWVDELCDLTLDQLADVVGKGAVEEIR